ncbi:MAG: hypothetical protein KDB50_07885 [Mycobacterium sp.]|nr:hypothetical protein [Mycobacterium sp.]
MMVPVRSHLTAGLAAALVAGTAGFTAGTPQTHPALSMVAAPAVELAAALQPLLQPGVPDGSLQAAEAATTGSSPRANVGGITQSAGDWIINAYWTIQPWVEYGVELFAWATEWLPWPIGLLAPQSDIIYNAWQPFAESVVYSFAFLIDGQFELILPTLSAGIQTGITNLVQGEVAWILSFFPPLPPIGGAAAGIATRTTEPAPAAGSAETTVAEAEPTTGTDVTSQTEQSGAASEATEQAPEQAPEPATEAQAATAETSVTEVPARQSARSTARASRPVTPRPAAATTPAVSGASAAAADPDPAQRSPKAASNTDAPTRSAKSARSDRSAR